MFLECISIDKLNNNMKVFVFGGDHHNTIGVVRCIAQANYEAEIYVIVSANKNNCLSKTCKYVTRLFIVASQQEGLDVLLNNCSIQEKHVLICCSDGSAEIIDNHLDELKPFYHLQNAKSEAGRIVFYMDKRHITELAEKCGFTIPASYVMNTERPVPKTINYPCLTKPLVSIEGHKSDIITCINENALTDALKSIKAGGCKAVQIQQYIDKEYELSIVGCSLNGGEQLVLPGIIRKIREYPVKRGSSSFAVMLPWTMYKFDLDPVYKIMRELGYTGLFSIEFLHCKNKDYFLEVNLRNDGNGAVSSAGGVNLPGILLNSFLGKDIKEHKKVIDNPVYFMREEFDFIHIFERRLSLLNWIKDFKRTNFFLLYDKNDKGPFKKRRMSIIKRIIKLLIGRRV